MTNEYMVQNKDNEKVYIIYNDVVSVKDCWIYNGAFAWELTMSDGNTATFPKCDWKLFKRDWVKA